MITDAVNTDGDLLFEYPAAAVRISSDETPPSQQSEVTNELMMMSVTQSAGGQELDNASLSWKVSAPLTNRTQPANFSKMIDVLIPDDAKTRIHLGDYVTESEVVNPSGEKLTASSQLRPYHFGKPLVGERWPNNEEIFKPIQFNPMIDGKTVGNKVKPIDPDPEFFYWVHPQTSITDRGKTSTEIETEKWTLKTAVRAVCQECNYFFGDFINSPEYLFDEFDVLDDAPDLENVTLPMGMYLPEILDRLLHPYGYNWYVDYEEKEFIDPHAPDPTPSEWSWDLPKIVLFKKGVGTQKKLYHQAPGDALDPAKSNCNAYSVTRHIGDMHNHVIVYGDVQRREVTIPLYPAWPEASDTMTAEELKRSDRDSVYADNETVHRLWVANEGGDIDGLRAEILPAGDPPDFYEGVFELREIEPHRMRIEPPLTYQGNPEDKTRRDIKVEYTLDATDSVPAWIEYTGSVQVLPDQIGILFSNDQPPDELILEEDEFKKVSVRITCTIASSVAIYGESKRDTSAVNQRDVAFVAHNPQKFMDRQVKTVGKFRSVLHDDGATVTDADADVVDDTDAIQDYAEKLRLESGHAELDCEFVLPGFHLYYEIGDLLTDIEGRDVSLDGASPSATPVYCQITKREFSQTPDVGPVTKLTVDRGVSLQLEKHAITVSEDVQWNVMSDPSMPWTT